MIKQFFALSAVALGVVLPLSADAYGANDVSSQLNFYRSDIRGNTKPLSTFSTLPAAAKHCPKDVVVWLNTDSGIWLEHGDAGFGRTPHGAYVCRQEAALAHKRGKTLHK